MRATEEPGLPGGRLLWRTATVLELIEETPQVRSLVLDVPGWPGHRAGQHVDVRLTGEDGYQAQRSYSIASPPEERTLTLTVQRLSDGEVSPYLATAVVPGDQFEIRGPIGGHFVWTTEMGGPLFLIAGGSGIAPLMAMLRHRQAVGSQIPALLLYSSRTNNDIIYRDELEQLAAAGNGLSVIHTITDIPWPSWAGYTRRIDAAMLTEVGIPPAEHPHIYICGPTGLVEAAARLLVELGHDPTAIKTERFGPTGT
ncbi:MAG: ferredoxin reductase [Bauldia sp.]